MGKKINSGGGGKMSKVMSEFARGKLHSGSKTGPIVKSHKQAVAIGMSEKRKQAAGGYSTKKKK